MGKTFITGGHGGLGLSCSKYLATAAKDNSLILAGRSEEKMNVVAQELSKEQGIKVDLVKLDISSLKSVRSAAAACIKILDGAKLDAVILNAGGQFRGKKLSDDGFEETFATNVLGNFLLVQLLLPHISSNGRVIFVASGTHDPLTMDGRMVGGAAEPDAKVLAKDVELDGGRRYTTSKLCTVMTAYELDRRLKAANSHVQSIAYDPGLILDTDFLRFLPKPAQWVAKSPPMKFISRLIGITEGDLVYSGQFMAQLATEQQYSGEGGTYYQSNSRKLSKRKSSAVSYDTAKASALWKDLNDLAGVDEAQSTAIWADVQAAA